MKLKNKFFVLIITILIFFSPLISQAGVIPCGLNTDDTTLPGDQTVPCTLCHLIVGTYNLFDWGLKILITVAVVAIFIAGVVYIVSAGNEKLITTAKNYFKDALIGFIFVLTGWFLVNITMWIVATKDANDPGGNLGIGISGWNKFICSTVSTSGEGGGGMEEETGTSTPTGGGELPPAGQGGTLSDTEARARLSEAGINISSSGGCSNQHNTSCTSLQDIPVKAIDNIINIKTVCGIAPTITGGTEDGHKSHGSGRPVVDFHWNEQLASCLKKNTQSLEIARICTTPEDAQYRVNCTTPETNEHIHVAFQ